MTTPSAPVLTISRTFAAPLELVWRVWTEQAHLGHWMSPAGMQQVSSALDLRPGGTFHYGLKTPDGQEMWGRWVFREIDPPHRLEFVQSFSDAAGGMGRNPMTPIWPQETLSTMTLTQQGGHTTLLLRSTPINASEIELQTFADAISSMEQGWGGTLTQLEAYLTAAQT